MKKLILGIALSLAAVAVPAQANVNKPITSYDVEAYDYGTSSDKLGIIRLYSAGTPNVVAYLHFHRSSTTMPTDRTYMSGTSVHVHYYSSDWQNVLKLLDNGGSINFIYDSYYDNVYLRRTSAVN